MSKTKLVKQIENFAILSNILAPLCSVYNNKGMKPFERAAQIYNENYRSSMEFANVLRHHKNLMTSSVDVCTRLFENFEENRQNSIYNWSKNFFNLLHAAKKILDEVYNLAYTVGRTDDITTLDIENEKNPLTQIKRNVIIEDGDYDIYKKTMFDWKCSIQAIYVEEEYMKHIVEICNSRKSKFNPGVVTVNACTLRRTLLVPENPVENTPHICVLNAEMMNHKMEIQRQEKNNELTITTIITYLNTFKQFQRELVSFVFTNFSALYNETSVQCLRVFLEQQHSVGFTLIQKLKKLEAIEKEKEHARTKLDHIAWNDDIDKINTTLCSRQTCAQKTKAVGSLE